MYLVFRIQSILTIRDNTAMMLRWLSHLRDPVLQPSEPSPRVAEEHRGALRVDQGPEGGVARETWRQTSVTEGCPGAANSCAGRG